MNELREFVVERFSGRSVAALALIVVTYLLVWFFNPHLIDLERGRWDPLLFGIWTVMTLALTWNVDLVHDAKLIVVGLAGGLTIEWWGTNTELWTYYTNERPPLWIIPAWPIAALTIDRMTVLACRVWPTLERSSRGYWVVVPLFVAIMTAFLWPSIDQPASWVVIGIMAVVLLGNPRPEWDMPLFLVGAAWGVGLEYWGTSRGCWTYYTAEIPPYEAVLAHGFASIAFARGVQLLDWAHARWLLPGALTVSACASPAEAPRVQPDRKVVVIGWDGVRGDAIEAANTPNLDRLSESGGVSTQAMTHMTGPHVSAPGWTSVMTGVPPSTHGVLSNGVYDDRDASWGTVAHRAHEAGLTAVVYAVWPEFAGSVVGSEPVLEALLGTEDTVVDWTLEGIEEQRADLYVLHHDAPDGAGHASGFTVDNPAYIDAVEATDARLGRLLAVLEGRPEQWLVLVTTDHGGSGTDHGPIDADNQGIFLAGGVVGSVGGWTMSAVSHLDVHPTVLDFLGLDADPRGLPGRSLLN